MDRVNDIKLAAMHLHARTAVRHDVEPAVVRITTDESESDRSRHALLVTPGASNPAGFAAYLSRDQGSQDDPGVLVLPPALSYLEDGDVVRLNSRHGEIWVMYRRRSRSNSLLLTERCNSWCLMCSQPPKAKDGSLVQAWFEAIPLMSQETEALGFTGGEPTLLGDTFLQLVAACKSYLPSTALHILSNGRLFNYLSLAQRLSEIDHHDLMVGIPLYSDLAWQHEFIVQATGSFDQTIRGLMNLARCDVAVEVRIVVHRQSVDRLADLAAFIARNLPFVAHVAIMGLEPIGFARSNFGALWIDPMDYHSSLDAAVQCLATNGINVSIYNHQLCILPKALWSFARQSISDWKNVYLPQCQHCMVRHECGGFFHSALSAHSRGIAPITEGM